LRRIEPPKEGVAWLDFRKNAGQAAGSILAASHY